MTIRDAIRIRASYFAAKNAIAGNAERAARWESVRVRYTEPTNESKP